MHVHIHITVVLAELMPPVGPDMDIVCQHGPLLPPDIQIHVCVYVYVYVHRQTCENSNGFCFVHALQMIEQEIRVWGTGQAGHDRDI